MSFEGTIGHRRRTRTVHAGPVPLGSGHPVVVQSMVKVDPHDPEAVARQADELAELGAGLVRLAIPDRRAAEAISEVRASSRATLVADIHFDPRLALAAMEAGAHKVRVNPGNLRGGEDAIREIARAAKEKGVPIRIGANSGSMKRNGREGDTSGPAEACGEVGADGTLSSGGMCGPGEAMAFSVIQGARAFERAGMSDLVLSAKGSSVVSTVAAGRILARETDYPIHVGVTAAGPPSLAWAKSAVGIGALLVDGIGDTIRVSYTGDPQEEVRAGFAILDALGLGSEGPEIVSCPTCGRTRVDLVRAVEDVRKALDGLSCPMRIAVMGCEVNGPGEARDADVGLACGRGGGYLFAGGKRLHRVSETEMVGALADLARGLAIDFNKDGQDGQDYARRD